MRIKRIILEHHRDAALRGGDAGNLPPADETLPGGNLLESRDHAQKRGLAAAGGPEQRREGARLDGERQTDDHFDRPEPLADVAQFDLVHRRFAYPLTPAERVTACVTRR